MVENRLRWFGHLEKRPIDSVVWRVDQMEDSQIARGRGHLGKTWRLMNSTKIWFMIEHYDVI